jgi:Type III secretion needle MxiH, YscF, SsaG, EprI, PscF, EscF
VQFLRSFRPAVRRYSPTGKELEMGFDKLFGSGSIFSSLMSLASMVMPQLQLLNAAFNLMSSAMGQAINNAMSQLSSEMGMPKFIKDAVNGLVEQIFGGSKKETSAEATEQMAGKNGSTMDKFTENLTKQIVENVKQAREEAEDNIKGGSSGGGGKKGWLRALAEALGKVADKAAKELEEMGKNINKENPSEMLDYQAATQEFNLMMQTFTNAIKTIGEAEGQAVRKG